MSTQKGQGSTDTAGWHQQQQWQGWTHYDKWHDAWIDYKKTSAQRWQSPQRQPQTNDETHKGKCKGSDKRKQPKDDETKRNEIHFTNFLTMASQKLMKFMIDLVNQYGLSDYIEKANDKDGNFLPICYAFGQVTAKACVIRFKTQDLAKEILRDLRNNGAIEFEGAGETRKIRINSGYDSRTAEQKAAEYQMRKLRSAILHHEVPRETWYSEWKQQKLRIMPEGKWEHKQEIARWNSKTWKLEFLKEMMEASHYGGASGGIGMR